MSDEQLQKAVEILLENFWILKQDLPNEFYLIRDKEFVLKPFFYENFHYNLHVNKYFARLEKIPMTPERWMGISEFKDPQDYALLCCLLAFLEKKDIDEQFLLSHILDNIKVMYPGDLDWQNFQSKHSICRVMRYAVDKIGMVKCISGDISQYQQENDYKILYQNTFLSRYFLRNIEQNLTDLRKSDLLSLKHDHNGTVSLTRAQKSYRRLFLSPVVHRDEVTPEEFDYLLRYRESICTAVEKYTNYTYEISDNEALLTTDENRQILTLSVNDRLGISNIALQFAAIIKRLYKEKALTLNDGLIEMTSTEYQRVVNQLCVEFSAGWSKAYREEKNIAHELLNYLIEWKMVVYLADIQMVKLYPVLVRAIGQYPDDFKRPEPIAETH